MPARLQLMLAFRVIHPITPVCRSAPAALASTFLGAGVRNAGTSLAAVLTALTDCVLQMTECLTQADGVHGQCRTSMHVYGLQ